jgi:putative ABC transport system substrate-binding protein
VGAGRNTQIDFVWAGGADDMQPYAQELVRSAPDVMLATSTTTTIALRQETSTIPIVFVSVSDPIGSGLVASLARPGDNITGFTTFEFSIGGKWIEILKEIDPRLVRIAVLFNPQTAAPYAPFTCVRSRLQRRNSERAVIAATVQDASEIERAIGVFASTVNGALIVLPDIFTSSHRELIISLAAKYRLPSVYPFAFFVRSGGLVSYGIDQLDLFRRAATYIDRILKGSSVGDLPIQQPTKFEFVINSKTAKALGLEIPPTLLAHADEVIE